MNISKGIDISHYQGKIDWGEITTDEISFIFMKATQGRVIIDPNFFSNWQQAGKLNIKRGAYHFYQGEIAPIVQADFFIESINKAGYLATDMPPALDVEINNAGDAETYSNGIREWLTAVETALSKKPIIYTNTPFWNSHVIGDFSEYPLWIADWETETAPVLPGTWKTWTFWQYSDEGHLHGIKDFVDLDKEK